MFDLTDFGHPLRELDRLQEDLERLFTGVRRRLAVPASPPVAVWVNDEAVFVTAELPGVAAEDLDVSVVTDNLTIRGKRTSGDAPSKAYLRKERPEGEFVRTISLPFRVDPEEVEAKIKNGVLELRLGRAREDRPRKVAVRSE